MVVCSSSPVSIILGRSSSASSSVDRSSQVPRSCAASKVCALSWNSPRLKMIRKNFLIVQLCMVTIRYGEWPYQFVKSSKIVKLPNTYNGIYEALRSASLNPERRKSLEAGKQAEWAASRSSWTEVSDRQFGHSLYRLLYSVYFHLLI